MSDQRSFALLSTNDTDLLSAPSSDAEWRLGDSARLDSANVAG